MNGDSLLDNISIETFEKFYKNQKEKYLCNQPDYMIITSDINELKKEYPRVKDLFDNSIFSDFSDKEKEVIKEIISLNEYLKLLEIKFSFSLGLRENNARI